jgi:hypothetical protein
MATGLIFRNRLMILFYGTGSPFSYCIQRM